MRDIERHRRSKTRYGACPGERLHKTDDVIGVDHDAIQQARRKAIRHQRRHTHGSIRTVERARMRQRAANIANQTPGIHLPRRPHALSKKEIAGQRCQRADHKTIATAKCRTRDNGDSAHRFKVGNGAKQDAPRRGQRRQHQRGHNLAQARARHLVTRKEQRKHQRHHDKHGQRCLLNARQQRRSHHGWHRQQQRDLQFCKQARETTVRHPITPYKTRCRQRNLPEAPCRRSRRRTSWQRRRQLARRSPGRAWP